MEFNDLPLGFGMALAKNPKAMQIFSNLSDKEKERIINGTHSIRSKNEMQEYVAHLTTNIK